MEYVYNDGGRSKYYKADNVGDCVCRAITIATGKDYKEVYDDLKELASKERITKRHTKKSKVRDGCSIKTASKYIESLGYKKTTTCKIGEGVSCHLCEDELPMGTLIVQIANHLVCVIDRVIYDTYNSSIKEYYDEFGNLIINDKRAVYGYWTIGR